MKNFRKKRTLEFTFSLLASSNFILRLNTMSSIKGSYSAYLALKLARNKIAFIDKS
jgi:hypothetical protein